MKFLILFSLFALAAIAEISQSKRSVESGSVVRKNAVNINYQHGMAGVSLQRNYLDYASVVVNMGTRQDPAVSSFSAGAEWTIEESTSHNGIYLNPSIVYIKTGIDRNRRFNDSYHDLYGVNLREDDSALGLSFILKHKWLFHRKNASYVIGTGAEVLRVRSSNGFGLIASLGIIF